METSRSLQQASPVPAQIPNVHRRATHHGVPTVYSPRQQPPTPAQLPIQVHGGGEIYDPEQLRQMFSQLQAYNTLPGAGSVTAPQYQYGPGPSPVAVPPPQSAPLPARPIGGPSMWTNGSVAHLQPPVYSQEQLQSNPYTGPAVFTEFAGGFVPPLGGFGTARTAQYTPPNVSQPLTPRRTSAVLDSPADVSEHGVVCIADPPDLDAWRDRLFHIEEMLVLTQQQYQIYWPHIDNVYSHRSTQRYKARPFLSHYYDCRLKGRPAGTPKSTDPNKKKRKRVARERDLCDVKVKITEYMPGATREDILGHLNMQPSKEGSDTVNRMLQGPTTWTGEPRVALNHEGALVNTFYIIQRVNTSATEEDDAAGEATDGRHRHTLEESDRVKKNSVIRANLKGEKQRRKSSIQSQQNGLDANQNGNQEKKTYHKKATGAALETVKRHSAEHDLKLYGSCFCPFVQRVWISLEAKKVPYQYIEVDPYAKPKSLLEVNPRGLVPALRHGSWGCYESSVLMEYLEDLGQGYPILPKDPKTRAHCRLWSDHINRDVTPAFYHYLQAQEQEKQVEYAQELRDAISKLVDAADKTGPFFLGSQLSFVDVQVAPWVLRMRRVLKPYRGWPDPDEGSRWAKWVKALEEEPSVKATTSGDDLYLDSYERYAENRPNTSQLANAVNSGRGLP